jgi:hypothetical protein
LDNGSRAQRTGGKKPPSRRLKAKRLRTNTTYRDAKH